jgi:EpsI family protein
MTGPVRLLNSAPARLLTLFLLAQAAVFYGLSRQEASVFSPPLSTFPATVGNWQMIEESPIDEDTRDILKADDLLSRIYEAGGDARTITSLFIAAFRSQRTGKAPHSPKNCLPGSGWTQVVSDTLPIDLPGRGRTEVNHYVVAKGEQRSAVLYWYQSWNRIVASEYRAKMFVVLDAMRYNRTDTALVRIVAPTLDGDDAAATRRAVEFAKAVFPDIEAHLPR